MDLTRNLKLDEVSRLKPTPPHSVPPDSTIGDAIRLMRQKQVGCLLICEDKKVIGIFTERDVLTRVMAVGRPLSDTISKVMSRDPATVFANDSVRRAMIRMQRGGFRHLPVIDEMGRAQGILSIKRLIHYLATQFSSAVYTQRSTSDAFPVHRGGA